jgi:hypothetical protein
LVSALQFTTSQKAQGMKRYLLTAAMVALLSSPAGAEEAREAHMLMVPQAEGDPAFVFLFDQAEACDAQRQSFLDTIAKDAPEAYLRAYSRAVDCRKVIVFRPQTALREPPPP